MSLSALLLDRMVVEFQKHVALDFAFALNTRGIRYAVNAVRRECQDVIGIVGCFELECRRILVLGGVGRAPVLCRFCCRCNLSGCFVDCAGCSLASVENHVHSAALAERTSLEHSNV